MRMLVLSDTHGDNSRAYQVYEKLNKQAPLDLIIHCGDYYKDAIQLSRRVTTPLVYVKGNTDGSFSHDAYTTVDTEFGTILVTHGHMEKVDYSQQNLYYKALENGCCAAVYGHTHRSAFTEVGGIYLLNPGSLTKPRDGSGGTFGLIITSEQDFRGYIYRYEDFVLKDGPKAPGGTGHKVQGGYLRSLLNYSDRF